MKNCGLPKLMMKGELGLAVWLFTASAMGQFAEYTNLAGLPAGAAIKPEATPPAQTLATGLTAASVTPPAELGAGTNALPSTLSSYVPDDKYRLRAGDRVALQIIEDRDAPKSITIADSGELDVPYIGRVMAKDKTCKQVATEAKELLEKEYYHRATVVIALDVANKYLGRVYVWGQVRNQGAIEVAINENITAGKAILRAGGFGDFANKKKVKIVRTNADGTKQSFELNMATILEDGRTELDMTLQPDDFIIVPSRLINF